MKRIGKLCSLVLALVLLLTVMPFPALAADLVNAKVTGTFCYGYARAQLDMVNDFRTGSEAWYWNSDDSTKTQYAAGELGTLVLDARLEQIAMERARELAVCYSHTRPNGESCFTLTVDGYQSYGENIAYGYTTPQSVFTAWREDNDAYSGQGHRRNMLRSGYTAVGFGCFYHQGIYYWAQEFSYYDGPAPGSKSDTEVTGYVPYSTSFLGEDYWSDEGNCPMSEYTPPSLTDGDWSYAVVSGKAMVTGYNGNNTNLTIPAKLGGYTVTKIADSAFYNEYYIDSVSFPSTLETIGDKAFYNSGLTGTVTIPASVKSIGTYAFSYTRYITEFSVSASNPNYCSYDGALYTKDKGTLLQYPLANERESYTVPEQTTLLYCTSFGNASHLKDLYVTGESVRAMTYTFYGDSFNVWCHPGTTLYSQISNGNLSGSVVLHDLSEASKPVITTQPKNYVGAIGSTATATVKATGEGLSYQWYFANPGASSFTKSGSKTATYSATLTEANSGRRLYCVIKDAYGNSVTSNTVTMTVAANTVSITTQPKNYVGAIGSAATATVTATGEGLTYQWYFANPGATSFTKSGSKTATYSATLTAANSGRRLYCVITDAYGNTVTTDTVTMTAANPLSITTQPKNYVGAIGSTATATVVAMGEGLTYQWYFANPGASSFTKSGSKTATYSATLTEANSGRRMYCVIKDAYGNSVRTNTVTMTASLSITTQPKNYVGAVGSTATATVVATGEGLTYQWYFANPGATSFTKSGSKTATYSATLTASNSGRRMYCVITDASGNSVRTNTVTMTASLSITTQPKNYVGAIGSTATATVKATGEGLTYQWYFANPGASSFTKSGSKTATYSATLTAANSGRRMYCVITDASGNTIKTNTVTMKVG